MVKERLMFLGHYISGYRVNCRRIALWTGWYGRRRGENRSCRRDRALLGQFVHGP